MNREHHELITQSNSSIQETYEDMTAKQLKLIYLLMADFKAANPRATSLEEVTQKVTPITLSELCNYLDLDEHNGGNTGYYKIIIKSFFEKAWIRWLSNDDNREHLTHLFTDISYPIHWEEGKNIEKKDKDYIIKFKWSDDFVVHLVQNTEFTRLHQSSVAKLNSPTAIRLYRLLKSYANKDKVTTITVSELRKSLRMEGKGYDRFGNFYTRGIKLPIDEINKHTEITVSATKNQSKSDKRRTESITFKIKSNDKKYTWDDSKKRFPSVKLTIAEYEEIKQWTSYPDWKRCCEDLQKLLDSGVDKRNHYAWIKGHHDELVKKQEARQNGSPSSDYSERKSKSSVRQSDRLSREPSFDIDEIARKAKLNDNYEL